MRIALLTTRANGPKGGAERLFDGLQGALEQAGADVERVEVVSDESSFDRVLRSYLDTYDLDLSAFDGVVSTKAPTYAVRHHNHVCYLVHTMRVYYDMFDVAFREPTPELHAQAEIVRQIDTAAFARPSVKQIFTVGGEVRDRLAGFNGVGSETLHHPTTLKGLRSRQGRHLLIPGRLHFWKRVDLAIEAAARMQRKIDLVISGTGEDAERLASLARGLDHVRFVGNVSDDELATLYADALAVLYLPMREDYGLGPIEAFMSGKPVITCTDSGEPTRVVRDGVSGFVCAPDPATIASRLDWLVDNPGEAERLGRNGRDSIAHVNWATVGERLMSALRN